MTASIIRGIIVGTVMILEYFLCTKFSNPLWGGIIPLLILGSTIYIFASGTIPLERRFVFPFVLLNIIYFGDWISGRESYKKKQQLEINKMKAKDI